MLVGESTASLLLNHSDTHSILQTILVFDMIKIGNFEGKTISKTKVIHFFENCSKDF